MDDALIETVARAQCLADGKDPDKPVVTRWERNIGGNSERDWSPAAWGWGWGRYVEEARRLVAGVEAMGVPAASQPSRAQASPGAGSRLRPSGVARLTQGEEE